MAGHWNQHIGDDQLVYGMPKHMSAVAGESSSGSEDSKGYYWTVHPKPKACDKCKAMAAWKYPQKPKRPHPNCKCEIKKHYMGVNIMGKLDGYGAHETHKFSSGQKITVEVRNIGTFVAGANVRVDDTEWKRTGHILPRLSVTLSFTKFGEIPLLWKVYIEYTAGDNSSL